MNTPEKTNNESEQNEQHLASPETEPRRYPGPGKTYYYIHDNNNNVVGMMDKDANIVARYAYDPFGNIIHSSGEMAEANPIRFSSEFHNRVTGLTDYLYRSYNPKDGRWTQRDPIQEQGGLNLYNFVGNDPVNHTDRLGLESYHKDKKNCTQTMKVNVRLMFYNRKTSDGQKHKWTKETMAQYKNDLKSTIEKTFNNNPYQSTPDQSGGCYKMKIEINFTDSSRNADWKVKVHAGPAGKDRASSSVSILDKSMNSRGILYEDSILPGISVLSQDSKTGEITPIRDKQIPALHEFGHALGLDHPGVGIKGEDGKTYKRNSTEEYTHRGEDIKNREVNGPVDLMGQGKGLRPFYFDRWKKNINK